MKKNLITVVILALVVVNLVLTAVLTNIGVPEEIAENDACKMEHVISEETFNCIKKHVEESHCL